MFAGYYRFVNATKTIPCCSANFASTGLLSGKIILLPDHFVDVNKMVRIGFGAEEKKLPYF